MAHQKPPPLFIIRILKSFRSFLSRLHKKLVPAPIALLEVGLGHWQGQALMVAAELNIADHIKNGTKDVATLAKLVGAHEESLYRILRSLAHIGIFSEGPKQHFSMTALARPLLTDEPDSIKAFVVMNRQPFHWRTWGDLMTSVKTGESAFVLREGKGLFDYLPEHKEEAKIFDEAMTAVSRQAAPFVAQGFNFSRFPVIADIGGGQGYFLSLVLTFHKQVRGILFDLEYVKSGAEKLLRETGVADRCQIQTGSFFETIPTGADAYLVKNIIHDWSDESSLKILTNIRQAMKPQARLLIVETVVPEGNSYHEGKLVDLEMLVHTSGGKERTEKQHRELLKRAGFNLVKVHPTAALESVLEAELV